MDIKLFASYFLIFICFNQTNVFAQELSELQKQEATLIDAIKEQEIGNTSKAIELFEKLRYEAAFSGVANYHLAKLFQQSGRQNDALLAIKESIKKEPDNKWYLVVEANLLEAQAQYCEAAYASERLSQIEIENYAFYDNAALHYLKCNNFEKSLAVLDRAFKKFGYFPPLSLRRAWILNQQGKNKKAIEILENALKEYPSHTELLPPIIEWYVRNSKAPEAEKLIKQLERKDPTHPLVLENKQNSSPSSGLATLESDIKDINLNLDQKIFRIVDQLNKAQNRSELNNLIPLAEYLTQQYAGESKSWALLGDLYYQSENLLKAIDAYETAIQKGPVPFVLWENMLYALQVEARSIKLEKLSNIGLDYYPNQPFMYYSLAQAQFLNEKYDEALMNIDQLLLMTQKNPTRYAEAVSLQAKIWKNKGDIAKAEKCWASIDAPKANAFIKLEKILFDLAGGIQTQEPEFLKLLDLAQFTNEMKYVKKSEYYYLTKNLTSAKEQIELALATGNPRYESFVLAGKIYSSLKLYDQAKKYFEIALQKTDFKAPVQRLLQLIP